MSKVVPEGWVVRSLGECTRKFYQGINTIADKLVYEKEGVPILQTKHITSGYISTNGVKFVSENDYLNYKDKYNPEVGDILLSNIGTIGKTVFVKRDERFLIAWNLFLIGLNEKIIPEYLFQFLKRLDDLNFYENLMTGNATKFINKTTLSEISIQTPPLPEQQKIASILTSVDEVIESTETQISKLQDLKKGMMQELLTKGIGHTEFKDSPVGSIPKEWESIRLADISASHITKGSTPTTYGYSWVSSGILFLRSESVKRGAFSLDGSMRISKAAHDTMKRSKINGGDILISITGYIGNACIFPEYLSEANINQHIARVRIRDKLLRSYVAQYINAEIQYRNYLNIQTGQAYPQLSLKQIQDTIIPCPKPEEMKDIVGVLESADSKMNHMRAKLNNMLDLKKALMQGLLTGKVRVKVN